MHGAVIRLNTVFTASAATYHLTVLVEIQMAVVVTALQTNNKGSEVYDKIPQLQKREVIHKISVHISPW